MKKKVLNLNSQSKKGQHKKGGMISLSFGVLIVATYCVVSIILSQQKMEKFSVFVNKLKRLSKKSDHNSHKSNQDFSIKQLSVEDFQERKRDLSADTAYISRIAKPLVYRKISHPLSAWMKDPTSAKSEIYVMENFCKSNRVKVYYNETDVTLTHEYILPYNWGGTGHVILDGNIYYNKYNSNVIVKYNFKDKKIVAELAIPEAGFGNQCPYQWAGSTDIDLALDNTGLWVIYGTLLNNWNMVISKLDPFSLEMLKTWPTKISKRSAGNAFIANGVLYALQGHDKRATSLHMAFDSNTNEVFKPVIPISLRYQYITMLDYNHKERKLYACDKGYLVTYDLTFA